MTTLAIYRLAIESFRGLKSFSWHPTQGVNVILGGGDIGKSTVLDAIGLLLNPTNSTALSDTDYHSKNIEAGFSIEAVVALPSLSTIGNQIKPSWPWNWNGAEAVVPNLEGDSDINNEPVYCLRVRGTADLELAYEIVQPDGTTDNLTVALRRAIGLVRLSGDDRNDRDLRLVQGSALDRLLSDKGLRSRLASELAKGEVQGELTDEAKQALQSLDLVFKQKNLPDGLDLAITGGQGLSVTALVGLTAKHDGVHLPLASWGAGTRRIAALTIAEQNQGKSPITLIDEVERGLEPYRQRFLLEKLQTGQSQVFVTTHSPYVISSSSTAQLWYMDHKGMIGRLDQQKIAKYRETDPEIFLARVTIIAEGSTELGFVTFLLEKAIGASLRQHGIYIADGDGHEATLGLLEALAAAGLSFGGFVDHEGKHPTRWAHLKTALNELLFRWSSGCIEENVIEVLPEDKFEALLIDPKKEKTGMRLRTLACRLGIDDKDFPTIEAKSGSALKELMIAAMLGKVPEDKKEEKKDYQAHGKTWFKTSDGGRELAEKLFNLDVWSHLRPQLLPFCNAVRGAINLPNIDDLSP